MRAPRVPSSPYAAPLDLLLGAPLRVRILRALSDAGDVRSASDLARLASADLKAVQRALIPSLEAGLVERIGGGRGAVYRLRQAHPFTAAIGALFALERERRQAIPREVAAWAEQVTPPPLAVWLYGSVARRQDHFGSDIDLAVIAPENVAGSSQVRETGSATPRPYTDLAQSLREALTPTADALALSPRIIGLLPADLLSLEERHPSLWRGLMTDSEPVFGPSAAVLVRRLSREAAHRAGR